LHNIVRKGIKNSSLFRGKAISFDDAIYDRKPAAAKVPEWMDVKWEKNKQGF